MTPIVFIYDVITSITNKHSVVVFCVYQTLIMQMILNVCWYDFNSLETSGACMSLWTGLWLVQIMLWG